MTNKKAIRILENIEYYLKTHTNESCEEEHTAIALAIKALKLADCPQVQAECKACGGVFCDGEEEQS